MILTCPQCQSQYSLDPVKLGAGRTVRCVSCSHAWFQEGAEGAVSAAPVSAPPPTAPQETMEEAAQRLSQDEEAFKSALEREPLLDEEAEQRARRARIRASASVPAPAPPVRQPFQLGANAFGGVVFASCLVATLGILIWGRMSLVQYWPRSAALYEKLGYFDAETPRLRLADVAAVRGKVDATVLEIEGNITNEGKRETSSPALHVLLRNKDDAVVKEWILRGGGKTLAAGESVPVKLKLPDTPAEGNALEIRIGRKARG